MENKVLKPKIRFKGFTDTWEQRKFKDYGSVAMCKRIFKYETSDSGDVPFYKIGTFGNKADAFITNEKYEYYKSKFSFPNKGDILLSASGTIGRIVEYSGEKAYFQDSNIVWLNHNDNIKNSFLKVLYPIVKWDGIEGSTIKRLYNSNFLSTEIHVPKVKEQEKIGVLFEKIDNLITLHQSKYDKLVNVKKALLEKMFPKDGKNVPEIRFKGFTDTWEQRKLNELTNIITKGTTPLDKVNEGTINFIKIENIDSFSGNINITSKITEEEHNSYLKRSQLKENDLLFSIAGTLGRVTVVKSDVLPANTNQALAIIRLKDGDINYIKTYLKGKTISNFIKRNPTIGAQPNLSLEQVGNFDIDMPNKEEQRKLGNLFNSIDNLITLHQHKLEKLKNMKKSLLNKMFI